jgi:hypothetical protein
VKKDFDDGFRRASSIARFIALRDEAVFAAGFVVLRVVGFGDASAGGDDGVGFHGVLVALDHALDLFLGGVTFHGEGDDALVGHHGFTVWGFGGGMMGGRVGEIQSGGNVGAVVLHDAFLGAEFAFEFRDFEGLLAERLHEAGGAVDESLVEVGDGGFVLFE